MRLIPSIILCGLFVSQLVGSMVQAQDAAEPVWPTREWLISTPELQGMDSAALAKLVTFGTSRSFDSVLVARHGRIVLDVYSRPTPPTFRTPSTPRHAQARLFDPLGIKPPFWRRDPQGLTMGAGGLALVPHDMAKIG